MTQHEREIKIKTSPQTVARDFSKRDILSEKACSLSQEKKESEETSPEMTRREAFKNLGPVAGRGLRDFLRSLSMKLNGDSEK